MKRRFVVFAFLALFLAVGSMLHGQALTYNSALVNSKSVLTEAPDVTSKVWNTIGKVAKAVAVATSTSVTVQAHPVQTFDQE